MRYSLQGNQVSATAQTVDNNHGTPQTLQRYSKRSNLYISVLGNIILYT